MDEMTQITPEQEIAHAQSILDAARAKRAAAAELNEQQARAEIAAYKAREEAQIAAAKAKQEEVQRKFLERQKKEAEAEAEKARMEAEHQRGLEAVAAKAEAERQAIQAHNDQLKRLTEEAYMAEQEAKQLVDAALAAAQRANQLREETGVTVNPEDGYFEHPLRKFIKPVDIYAEDKPSVAPVAVQVAPQPSRKVKREVDYSASGELEQLFRKELKITVNGGKLDTLSATFTYEALIKAARTAVSTFKTTPMSADGLLALIETLADAPEVSDVPTTP